MNKKVLGTILGIGTLATLGLGATTAHAAETINNGTNTGDVQINGTLGQSNTDPEAPINEGSNQWINVTLDTATIFYNTAGSTTIESPDYDITNNSGRPVSVVATGITQTNSVDISSISSLAVNLNRNDGGASSTASLVTDGTTGVTGATSLVLANNVGQIASTDEAATDSSTVTNNAATFQYDGTLSSALSETIAPTFTMTLTFAAQSWE
ncbi:hypothetical protein [Enterococcus sp. HY326]|uniref:hypothetical protein n=1 Tax=Enterococcus sp. HY326 TaxID=2971265 RepID=UPI002240DA22|nr:hypothetical protein [Enterococcus sp. HY326]